MQNESGLIRLGAIILVAILALGAVAWGTGLGSHGSGTEARAETPTLLASRDAGSDGDAASVSADDAVCRVEGEPIALPQAVHEASGVALGRGGVLWTHSDAGQPEVVAVSADGQVRGAVRIAGASAVDWEDIAVGPCASGSCLYLADIGDNDASRAHITVYRVPEPDPSAGASAPAAAIHASYPDGAQDAEALFVDGDGRIYVVTKGETGPIAVYRFPDAPGGTARLERVKALSTDKVSRSERITGADRSPDGRWVALRTLRSVSFYPAAAVTGGAAGEPTRFDLSAADEAQGEGIALGANGEVFLASEGGKKKNPATLTRATCPLPR